MVVGHLVGGDEVARSHLGAVEPELVRDRVHRALHREDALRPAGPAVGRHDDRVRVERPPLAAVGAGLVGTQQLGRGDDGHDDAVRRVGAVVVPEAYVQREQAAVVVEADLDLLQLPALVRRRDEVLAAVLDPLDLAVQPPGRPRHQHLLRPRVHDLHPETAADHGRDALDLAGRQPELGGHRCADAGRRLGRGVDAHRAVGRVPAGVDALALHRHRRAALDVEGEGQPARCGSHRGVDVADLVEVVGGDVVGDVVVHRAIGSPGVVHPDDRRQDVVGDQHPLRRVLGEVPVAGDHHHHRLPDVVDLVAGERVAGARSVQRRVRDEQRQRLGDRAALALVGGQQVVVGVDRDEPLDLERAGGVDVGDPGVGVRAADERDPQGGLPEVVEEVRGAGDELGVLDPLHRLAEQSRRHEAPRSRVISAARSTLATMFW